MFSADNDMTDVKNHPQQTSSDSDTSVQSSGDMEPFVQSSGGMEACVKIDVEMTTGTNSGTVIVDQELKCCVRRSSDCEWHGPLRN